MASTFQQQQKNTWLFFIILWSDKTVIWNRIPVMAAMPATRIGEIPVIAWFGKDCLSAWLSVMILYVFGKRNNKRGETKTKQKNKRKINNREENLGANARSLFRPEMAVVASAAVAVTLFSSLFPPREKRKKIIYKKKNVSLKLDWACTPTVQDRMGRHADMASKYIVTCRGSAL